MLSRIFMATVLLTGLAFAKEPKHHQGGTLLQMDSVECGLDENSGKSFVGGVLHFVGRGTCACIAVDAHQTGFA